MPNNVTHISNIQSEKEVRKRFMLFFIKFLKIKYKLLPIEAFKGTAKSVKVAQSGTFTDLARINLGRKD